MSPLPTITTPPAAGDAMADPGLAVQLAPTQLDWLQQRHSAQLWSLTNIMESRHGVSTLPVSSSSRQLQLQQLQTLLLSRALRRPSRDSSRFFVEELANVL